MTNRDNPAVVYPALKGVMEKYLQKYGFKQESETLLEK